jgi:hypothetical protein
MQQFSHFSTCSLNVQLLPRCGGYVYNSWESLQLCIMTVKKLIFLQFQDCRLVTQMTSVRDAWLTIWSALVQAIWWSRNQLVFLSVVRDGHDPRGCKVKIMELVKRSVRWLYISDFIFVC